MTPYNWKEIREGFDKVLIREGHPPITDDHFKIIKDIAEQPDDKQSLLMTEGNP